MLFVIYKKAGIYSATTGTATMTGADTLGYVAVAIVGAGVAVLPATAAGAASSRILAGLPSLGAHPVAITGGATLNGATYDLDGTVITGGLATNYYFEYGSSASYGGLSPVASLSAGDSGGLVKIEAVRGLAQNHHYRLVAHNAAGTAYGEDKTVP